MKKIMLVDDEILIREIIRDCIDWETHGFRFCCEASDGELALPLIEKHQPDILLTDIKMPFMDGLELTRIVRNRMPQMKIIILSGHDEFSYAQSAIRLGVQEYCLKPVSAADLLELLRTVSERIDEEHRQNEQLQQMKQIATDHLSLQRNKLFNDLCNGQLTTAEAMDAAAKVHLQITARYYAVCITDVRTEDVLSAASPFTADETESRIQQELKDFLIYYYRRSRSETVWILKSDSKQELQERLHRFRKRAVPCLERDLSSLIIVGNGTIQNRLQGIHTSYLEAEDKKTHLHLMQLNRRELEKTRGSGGRAVLLDRNGFLAFLKIGILPQVKDFIHTFAEGLRDVDWRSTLYGYYLLNDVTLEAMETVSNHLNDGNTMEKRLLRWQAMMRQVHDWESACEYFIQLAEEIIELRDESAGRYTIVVEKVKSFIQQNYDRDSLSLQDVAAHVSLSPSHLSKIFSQCTGTTFIEYLTQVRIQKAMELLMTTTDKIYEIAVKVGYNDAHYFSNLFKKMTGMTTKQFRKEGHAEFARRHERWKNPYVVSSDE